jgi:hypothetical protein
MTACGSATPTAAPTVDLNPFRTEVAATVLAQVSEAAALIPSATTPPTITPTSEPTFTSEPTLTNTPADPTAAAIAALTLTPAAMANNRAQWVSQSITDGTVFAPNETFTITWRLKNVGAAAWTLDYRLRFYSGNPFGAPQEILLGREVPPEETVDITIPMTAPALPGDYRTDWVMSNESFYNFKDPVFLKITVALPPTATRTPTATPAATATP